MNLLAMSILCGKNGIYQNQSDQSLDWSGETYRVLV